MRPAGRLNIHSVRHMLLLLHLSTSGISVAAACAEAAICTDKSLITRHKQQADPLRPPARRQNRNTPPFTLCLPLPAGLLHITPLKDGQLIITLIKTHDRHLAHSVYPRARSLYNQNTLSHFTGFTDRIHTR
ncbi:Hypothetical predicted protein [Xyrichtys novacula]|uniref:Secreted protein n=1 Tax=Xyrichtys novacula TaxID=13765 RepID=A0AAV1GXI6_XYRNO|nr:Hypothetical predicted protein [Xyrichtys novacula]